MVKDSVVWYDFIVNAVFPLKLCVSIMYSLITFAIYLTFPCFSQFEIVEPRNLKS